ncbi:MAG: hypothetical protein E4G98_04275 [Promethearchaeota archaeon]|nr:MAG: hypothetical protein E4G98_04275 [Candidatus Lokiarchaeota archaeon]
MSNDSNFQPYTPQLGIVGSSYQLQMGKVNKFWAVRLVKGKDVLASKVFKDQPDPEELPLNNQITGWILSVLAIPNLNTYQIQKTVGFIRQKAQTVMEDQELKRQSGGKDESRDAKLEKVPDDVQVKRPQVQGWVKEEPTQVAPVSDEVVTQSPGLASSNQAITGYSTGTVESLKAQSLPEIPKGEGFVPQPFSYRARGVSANIAQVGDGISGGGTSKMNHMEIRLAALEKRVTKLEFENMELKDALNR